MSAHSSERDIPFACPHCGHHTEVSSKFAGRSGPCVSCSNVITVPTLESLIAPTAATNRPARRRNEPKPVWIQAGMVVGALLSIGVLGVVVWSVLQPAFDAARSAAKCSACEDNLRQIGSAIELYYEEKGHYPPAYSRDKTGKKLHSWRVLILPYLGPDAQLVYEQIKLDQPWDGPDNIKLVQTIPDVYRCPADTVAITGETSYLAIVDDNTVINADRPTKRSLSYDGPILRDNPAETMVVLEAANSSINWMEPKDIGLSSLPSGLDSSNQGDPRSEHLQGVNILMADQSIIRLMPDIVETDDLRGMATIAGGNEYIEVLEDIDY